MRKTGREDNGEKKTKGENKSVFSSFSSRSDLFLDFIFTFENIFTFLSFSVPSFLPLSFCLFRKQTEKEKKNDKETENVMGT